MTQRKASSKHEAMQICAHFALVMQATVLPHKHSALEAWQIWQSSLCLVVLILSSIGHQLYVVRMPCNRRYYNVLRSICI